MPNSDIPAISVRYQQTGQSRATNAQGMRPMQERAFQHRGEQYLLVKAPPASGKSRALMFIALDKLHHQGVRQAIITVPERAIGASFRSTPLPGFFADWEVEPRWNLCDAVGGDSGKVSAVGDFLESADRVLVTTHATFRFAVERFGIEAFDDCLIAIDEFHHVSADTDANRLGDQLRAILARDKAHVVAMTGSYFRGDAVPILMPEDEAKFDTVTYTYYEQLNGYKYLKQLDIGYYFYAGSWVDSILDVLDPAEKTIIHIPSVNSRESTKDKYEEVNAIIGALGQWQGRDAATGFQRVLTPGGRVLQIADLVDDDPAMREPVVAALKAPATNKDRDHVDIIIALGMAKEGFDWVWCEHALTVGYRASLTEVVQIIGRATRDAPGKARARFTNLIAEPDAAEDVVNEAVNDTLKAIAASLLMEQVLVPRFDFLRKEAASGPEAGVDYGPGGYDPEVCNVGAREDGSAYQIEIKGLIAPVTPEAQRVCAKDISDVVAAIVQDQTMATRGAFDTGLMPQELTVERAGKIVRGLYPDFPEADQEAIRQRAVAALNLMQKGAEAARMQGDTTVLSNTALIDGIRRYAMDVRDLDMDLIERINPFGAARAILAKAMNADTLRQIQAVITARRTNMSIEDARDCARRAVKFRDEHGRLPDLKSADPWERHLAEGVAYLARLQREAQRGAQG